MFKWISIFLICVSARSATNFLVGTQTTITLSNAVTAASAGDTIIIPTGTHNISNYVGLFKTLMIQGTTNTSTGDYTILQDFTPASGGFEGNFFVVSQASANQTNWITGIWFQNGNKNGASFGYQGGIKVNGWNNSNSWLRVSHCMFYFLFSFNLYWDTLSGVVDRNEFHMSRSAGDIPLYMFGKRWNSDTDLQGYKSWASTNDYSALDHIFIENNGFTYITSDGPSAVTDGYGGARWEFRYNSVTNGYVGNHGAESSQIAGTRFFRAYGNHFQNTSNPLSFITEARSGNVIVVSNTVSSVFTSIASLQAEAYRTFAPFNPWGGATGVNVYDTNVVAGSPFETGTATGGTSLNMQDGSKAWTPNQWFGYTLRNLTSGRFSQITGNTTTNITYLTAGGFFPGDMTFSAGNSYEITKVIMALQQTGTGTAIMQSGIPPTPAEWPHRYYELSYSGSNLLNGTTLLNVSPRSATIVNGRDFTNNVIPSWTFAQYPHPLIAERVAGPFVTNSSPVVATNVPLQVSGLTTISGMVNLR